MKSAGLATYLYESSALLAILAALAAYSMRDRRIGPPQSSMAIVIVFGLLAITPLCGLMFDCGCDWPWHGLHADCNYFSTVRKLKCPWCQSAVAGSLSMAVVFGSSGIAACWTSSALPRADLGVPHFNPLPVARGTAIGLAIFHLVSLAAATASALATGYPQPFRL